MAIIKRKIENLKPGKEYIVTARAKNADVNVVSNYTDTIRFRVPVDTTIPEEVFNLKLYQGVESVMFVFDNVSDKDILTYEYELYSDMSGTQLVSTGYNDASVFTVAVDNLQTDAQGQGLVPYWGRVRAIDTSNNTGAWTPLAKTDERVPLIDNQFIGSLTASKITAGSIGAHEIILTQPGPQTTINVPASSSVLRSSNYNGNYNSTTGVWTPGTSGWIITGDGRAELNNAVIRGKLSSISLDVGEGEESFHIDENGNMWSGSQSFAAAEFSVENNGKVRIRNGSIDIGDGANSFHVDDTGNMWTGSNDFNSGKFRVSNSGNVTITGSLNVNDANGFTSPANFGGSVYIEGSLECRNTFSGNTMYGDLFAGYTPTGTYGGRSLMSLSTGNLFLDLIPATDYNSQTILRPYGHTQLRVTRLTEVPYLVRDFQGNISNRPSHWNKQIIQILNDVGANGNIGNDVVAGIAFGVGKPISSNLIAVAGCSIRCFPGSGGSQVPPNGGGWISSIRDDGIANSGWNVNADTIGNTGSVDGSFLAPGASAMTGAGAGGLDISNYKGDGYGYIGAASFVMRSSKMFKENIEYMPAESKNISVERIRNLKPARWDDKAKIAYGAPSRKFQDINARWIAKGKTPLKADLKHFESFDHNCAKDDCIGNEYKDCPEVEFQKKRYGFIAEDVAEVFPKAVQYSVLGQPMGIDYSVITYSLVETTQHLLDKIDQLEAKISELTAENNN